LIIFSCKKAPNRTCFKSTGKEVRVEIALNSFNRLELYEHLEYELIQDSLDKVVVIGGSNLVNKVSASIEDNSLILKNENKCAFLRSYKKVIKVEIHLTNLTTLNYYGTEPVTNLNKLKFSNFNLTMKNGSGKINLNLDADQLFANVSSGYGDFVMNGTANYANIQVKSNGFCNTNGLVVLDSITVVSNTPAVLKINANLVDLRAEIKNGGDIYYIGVPSIILLNQYGKGSLINKN
jgi:hypothetical protein